MEQSELDLLIGYICEANPEGVYQYLEARGIYGSESIYLDALNYVTNRGGGELESFVKTLHPDYDLILYFEGSGRTASFLPNDQPQSKPEAPKGEGLKISITDALLGVAVIALIVLLSKS